MYLPETQCIFRRHNVSTGDTMFLPETQSSGDTTQRLFTVKNPRWNRFPVNGTFPGERAPFPVSGKIFPSELAPFPVGLI